MLRTSAAKLARRCARAATARRSSLPRQMIIASSAEFSSFPSSRHLSSLQPATVLENESDEVGPLLDGSITHKFAALNGAKTKVFAVDQEAKAALANRAAHPVAHPTAEQVADEDVVASPSHMTFTGSKTKPITSVLKIYSPEEDAPRGIWPMYRIMDESGEFRDPKNDGYVHEGQSTDRAPPSAAALDSEQIAVGVDANKRHDIDKLRSLLASKYPAHFAEIMSSSLLHAARHPFADTGSDNTLLRAHRQMIRLRQMDNILQNAQRQGRISFYMTCRGEEAIHMGSASALEPQDVVLAQYREAGVLMWRGFTLEQFTNQCFANNGDLGKGRQMPVHYGSRALNYHTISSPLGTQIPQAAGAAYRMKLANESLEKDKQGIAICYFGDGCASTTDFHAGLNFAATLGAPAIFFCRNNGYAISTSIEDQYAGDGIISRAPGYGMAGIRVDGNDLFAVNAAVSAARSYCLEHNAPALIEAMTYRQGHHSTSDDSTRYRGTDEVNKFNENFNPVKRMHRFMGLYGWLDTKEINQIRDEERLKVLKAMEAAEARPPPKLETLFQDVYYNVPEHLQRQEHELREHIAKYPGKY